MTAWTRRSAVDSPEEVLRFWVQLAEELVREARPEQRRMLEHSASQARGHCDVVARFGRQPHRNAVLGRVSTPQELEYLASAVLVHQRPLPRRDS